MDSDDNDNNIVLPLACRWDNNTQSYLSYYVFVAWIGQRVKTATDLDTSMESIATLPENANLIPTAVKGFPELCEEPYLPQSEGKYGAFISVP